MTGSSICTRVASLEEVVTLIQWAGSEGWNPGLDDAPLFHATDPSGFFITTIDEQAAAGISVVKHSDQQAFLGLYLCLPRHRGSGVGLATWNAALGTLTDHTVGLDGVVEQQANYRKSGFVYHFGNMRYSGTLASNPAAAATKAVSMSTIVRPATSDDCQSLIRYDALVGGFERSAFFSAWLDICDTRHTYLAIDEGAVAGVMGIRKCIDGFKIGPLLADSKAIAVQLMSAAADIADGANVMLDVPDKNPAAAQLAESFKLQPVFETARMYRGPVPVMDVARLFGVATLELG